MPTVSIIIPVYNGAVTLSECLQSIQKQNFSDFEALLIDDGSTDDTRAIIQQFSAQDKRLKLLPQEHRGIVAALNHGLEAAKGRFIARLDADDLCLPGRLAAQAEMLLKQPHTGLVSGQVIYGGDRKQQHGYALHVDWLNSIRTPEQIRLNRFVESPFAHPSVMFRRELPENFGAYRDGDFPEDYELWLRWLDAGVQMNKTDIPAIVWNDPEQRLSRTDPRYSTDAFYRCKAVYLSRLLKRESSREQPEVIVWGAGRITRKRAEHLTANGISIKAYVDIDPKKIGQTIHGRPVLDVEEIKNCGPADFILSYVGLRGARENIRQRLNALRMIEGRDFLMIA